MASLPDGFGGTCWGTKERHLGAAEFQEPGRVAAEAHELAKHGGVVPRAGPAVESVDEIARSEVTLLNRELGAWFTLVRIRAIPDDVHVWIDQRYEEVVYRCLLVWSSE